jgi:hypothetical protein
MLSSDDLPPRPREAQGETVRRLRAGAMQIPTDAFSAACSGCLLLSCFALIFVLPCLLMEGCIVFLHPDNTAHLSQRLE